MKKKLTLSESDLAKVIQNAVEKKLMEMNFKNTSLSEAPEFEDEDYEEEEESATVYDVEDPYFELSDSDIVDIESQKGPKRRFRGSIYVDYSIPETGDVEYDRKLAKEVLNYFRKKMEIESYVGGVAFKTSNRLDPFDSDF